MRTFLGILAIVLVIIWLVGFFAFAAAVGGLIHIALVLAVVAFIFRYIKWGNDRTV